MCEEERKWWLDWVRECRPPLLLKIKQNEVNLAESRARSVWVGRRSLERQARWLLGERG